LNERVSKARGREYPLKEAVLRNSANRNSIAAIKLPAILHRHGGSTGGHLVDIAANSLNVYDNQ
jgi:hypothetical protein